MPRSRSFFSAIFVVHVGLVSLLGIAPAVDASLFVAMAAEELVGQSDAIVQGDVIRQRSQWDEQHQLIVTDTMVEVSEVIVGHAPTVVTVRTPGGTVGNVRVQAPGFPQLKNGEEVILFLEDDQEIQRNRIVGHQQGHVEVVRRVDGVALAVPRIEDGAGFFTPSGKFVPAPPSTELESFKGRIRAEAARLGRVTN